MIVSPLSGIFRSLIITVTNIFSLYYIAQFSPIGTKVCCIQDAKNLSIPWAQFFFFFFLPCYLSFFVFVVVVVVVVFYFILLYNTVLVLPYTDMNPPRVYMHSQT